MAWRSSGETNDEMVDKLKLFGVIHSLSVEDAFRSVDRRFFVPPGTISIAHRDQPIREGNIHISAPHIYGTVLEALDVQPASTISFLNIGSGTGYLSCMVAHILGHTSTVYGVDLSEEAILHSQVASNNWKDSLSDLPNLAHLEFIRGNGLEIDRNKGEAAVGFDRIYIGAAVERKDIPKIAGMLKPGGILVGPVGDELVKVARIASSPVSVPSVSLASSLLRRGRPPLLSDDFTVTLLSGVRFSALLERPTVSTVIPSRVWDPALHHLYPESFRCATKVIMLCSAASVVQAPQPRPPPPPREQTNVAATLPKALWMDILSFTHRDWFEQPESEESRLRNRVIQLELAMQRAHEARQELERRLRSAEGERDFHRAMSQTWQARLEEVVGERIRHEAMDVSQAQDHVDGSIESEDDSFRDDVDSEDESELPDMEEESVSEDPMSVSPSDMGSGGRSIRAVSIYSEDLK